MIEITEPLSADVPKRLSLLAALIGICKAETVADPLPDEFPVLPASLESVTAPNPDNPALLLVSFRSALPDETLTQRVEIAQDIAPAVVDFVLGRFDPTKQ